MFNAPLPPFMTYAQFSTRKESLPIRNIYCILNFTIFSSSRRLYNHLLVTRMTSCMWVYARQISGFRIETCSRFSVPPRRLPNSLMWVLKYHLFLIPYANPSIISIFEIQHTSFQYCNSAIGGKQWQTTPKNLPMMQRTRAIPVAWLSSGLCPDRPKGQIPVIIIIIALY
jgi:hypothetical protein